MGKKITTPWIRWPKGGENLLTVICTVASWQTPPSWFKLAFALIAGWALIHLIVKSTPLRRMRPLGQRLITSAAWLIVCIPLYPSLAYISGTAPNAMFLTCDADDRVSLDHTRSGSIPGTVVYLIADGFEQVASMDTATHDISDGAIFQLANEQFVHCHLRNDGPYNLADVTISFQGQFLGAGGNNWGGNPIPVTVRAANLAAQKSFDFGIANFSQGGGIMSLRPPVLLGYRSSAVAQYVDKRPFTWTGISEGEFQMGLVPQPRNRRLWRFFSKCHNPIITFPIKNMADASEKKEYIMQHLSQYLPPECTAKAQARELQEWKKQHPEP